MLVRWAIVVVVFLYALGALGTFIVTVGDGRFNRRERYIWAAAERSLVWPAAVPELARELLED